MRHILCLTTIPPRFHLIGPALAALTAQRSRPEAVELWLPRRYRRFPGYAGELPEVPPGITLRVTETDLGPATKILPAVQDRKGQEVVLIYGDDDLVYAPDWASRLLAAMARRPGVAVAAGGTTVERLGRPRPEGAGQARGPRAVPAPPPAQQWRWRWQRRWQALRHLGVGRIPVVAPFRMTERAGFVDVAEGYGGVAVRPDYFDAAVMGIPPVLWSVDDIWLSGHLERRGIGIWTEPGLDRARLVQQASATQPLYAALAEGKGRRDANRLCIDYFRERYGIWGGTAPGVAVNNT